MDGLENCRELHAVSSENPPDEVRCGDYYPGEILLGKYQLVELLAVGGMGAIWRARNQLLEADVAVKVMFHAAPYSETVNRAHAEARLAAQLHHPAVCATIDFGISDAGDPIVVSELLQGEDLDTVLQIEGRLSAVRAAQVLLPVIDGLACAHNKGIIHRDIKPANIFLAYDETGNVQPKLLDFGVARGSMDKQRLTIAGAVCGTPTYMSPEQARGSIDVDHRSDLWNVCATLYELVTGRQPFEGDNYNSVMFAVANDPHAPIVELSEMEQQLIPIIERGLSKDREARFQSTRELSEHLSLFLLARGVETDACGHSLRSRLSKPEINLSQAERAVAQAPTSPKLQPVRSGPRSAQRLGALHGRSSLPRKGLLALGLLSLIGLGAWDSTAHPTSNAFNHQANPKLSERASPIISDAALALVPAREMQLETVQPTLNSLGVPVTWKATPLEKAQLAFDTPHGFEVARSEVTPTACDVASNQTVYNPNIVKSDVPAAPPSTRRKPHGRSSKSNALGYDFGL